MKIDIILEALGTIVLVVGIASLSIPIGIMAAAVVKHAGARFVARSIDTAMPLAGVPLRVAGS